MSCNHPFISSLVRTFKDESRVYFLIEYIKGLSLFEVLTIMDQLTNDESRFFSAGILLIIEYLHTHNIIYRDLKPENIIISEDGYPRISDFSIAKVMENRTYSTVGTPHYMAPEIILGKGYGAFKNDHLRIANFPAHSKEQVEMLCDLLASY